MKKAYNTPKAAVINIVAENLIALSIPVVDGKDGGVAGSNHRIVLDFDEEEEWED